MKNKIFLAIDFDATIADKVNDTLVLKENAREAMQAFREAGCYILIDSSRANPYRKKEGTVGRSLKEMQEFLDNNQICYDAINGITFPAQARPISDFYIGNNNRQLITWQLMVKEIIGKEI